MLPGKGEEWYGQLPCGMELEAGIDGQVVGVQVGEHVADGSHGR